MPTQSRGHGTQAQGLSTPFEDSGRATQPLFPKEDDYEAFERVLDQALGKQPTRILAYCLMLNHFYLLRWPWRDGARCRRSCAGGDSLHDSVPQGW